MSYMILLLQNVTKIPNKQQIILHDFAFTKR